VRYLGRHEYEVVRIVCTDVVRDETPSATVEGERQLALRMMMPLKGNLRNPPVEHANGTAFGYRDVFKLRFHTTVDLGYLILDTDRRLIVRIVPFPG
jgi:hypothetical protein